MSDAPVAAHPAPAAGHDAAALRALRARQARAGSVPWLHAEVARRMAGRLDVIKCRPDAWLEWSALVGGGGEALRAAYPRARRVVVEPDTAAFAQSLSRAARPWWSPRRLGGRADLVLDAARVAEGPEPPVQLLWANMALHLADDPAALMVRWHRWLQVDGFLMFSTLGPDTLRELRAIHARQGWGPAHLPFVDMHDLGDMLVAAGFADPVMDQERLTLTWSSAEAALTELRGLGGNTHPGRFAGLRTPRWRRRLLDALAEGADAQGRIGMSFEVVYGHAFRVAPRVHHAIQSTVSLDQLRATLPPNARRKGGA